MWNLRRDRATLTRCAAIACVAAVAAAALALGANQCKPPVQPQQAEAGTVLQLPWLDGIQPLIDRAVAAPQPARHPFGRVRLSVKSSRVSAYCPDPPCSDEAHLYVRAERTSAATGGGTETRILPQCSALGEAASTLELLGDAGPLDLPIDAFTPGRTITLHPQAGFEVRIAVESWSRPEALVPDDAAAWSYVRALVVAHAHSFGVELPLLWQPGAVPSCAGAQTPYARDACDVPRGSPIALLSAPDAVEPLNGRPQTVPTVADDRKRQRIEAPVSSGSWSRFCGRPGNFEYAGIGCAEVKAHMQPFMDALVNAGVDRLRFVRGAILTNGATYYPQVNVHHFAKALECAGWTPAIRVGLEDMTRTSTLDWQNRLRAACLLRQLDGKSCDAALLEQMAGVQPADDDDGVDERCLGALMGEVDFFCLAG